MFLKQPFISGLLVGSIIAILTAGAETSAPTTTAATTQTTGATAENQTTR